MSVTSSVVIMVDFKRNYMGKINWGTPVYLLLKNGLHRYLIPTENSYQAIGMLKLTINYP